GLSLSIINFPLSIVNYLITITPPATELISPRSVSYEICTIYTPGGMFSQICALMLSFSTLYNSPPHLSKILNSITCISHGEKSSNSSFTPSPLGVIALGSDTGHSSSQSVPSSTSMYPVNSQPSDSITKGYRSG